MSDLIDRQAAQTELMMKCERYTLAREESNGMVGYVEWSSDLISVADAMDAIRDLPSAQPEQRKKGEWISVKDKVPCNQNPVIVSVPPHTNCDGEEFVGYVGMAYFTDSAKGGFWCGTDGNVYGAIGIITTPTHWMPLPEPYNGDVMTKELNEEE